MALPRPPGGFDDWEMPEPRKNEFGPPVIEPTAFADQPDPYFLPLEQAGPGFGRRALEALGGLRVSMGPGTSRGEAVGGTALGLLAMLGNSLARERARREAAGVKEAEATNRAMADAGRRREALQIRAMGMAERRATAARREARSARAEKRAEETHARLMQPKKPAARGSASRPVVARGYAFRMHPDAQKAVKAAERAMKDAEAGVTRAQTLYDTAGESRAQAMLEQARDAYEATLKRAIVASVLAVKDPENRREALAQAKMIYPGLISEEDLVPGPPRLPGRPVAPPPSRFEGVEAR